MEHSERDFYDDLADEYDLIFEDWDKSVRWQGEVLDALLRQLTGAGRLSVLDCSCGIGTQAIGLALRGHELTATDMSPRSVRRAEVETVRFGVEISFGVADFRALEERLDGTFDAVVSCDNALPHMLSREDLLLAARSIRPRLKEGGLFLASIRNYDHLLRERPFATTPKVMDVAGGRRIYFQVWDWEDDRLTYTVHLFLMHREQGSWQTRHHQTRYRALTRDELAGVLEEAGFGQIHWHAPSESGYYQPIVTARP
jgi:glycine/sarcosine N-methyltransferase